MGIFGPPNIEKLQAKGDVRGLIKALGYVPASYVRSDAARALGKIRDKSSVQPLIAALRDDDLEVRRNTARALGRIGDNSAVEPLIAILKDKETTVRSAAAAALGEIGDPRALEPFIANLQDSKEPVRRAAADLLDQLGWQPDHGVAGAYYWIVRRQWVRCARIGAPAVEPLLGALAENDQVAQIDIIRALGGIGDRRAIATLVSLIEDGEKANRKEGKEQVRQAAAEALGNLGWQPEQGGQEAGYWIARRQWERCVQIGAPAVEMLIATLKDQDENMRIGASEALGQIGDPRAVKPLIARFPEKYAVAALVQIGGPAVPALISALKHKDEGIRNTALETLSQIGAPSEQALITLLKGSDIPAATAAAEALGKIGWQPENVMDDAFYRAIRGEWRRCVEIGAPAVEPLIAVLTKGDINIRREAAGALGQIRDTRAVKPLIAALKDVEPVLRQAAAMALGQIGDRSAVQPLIAALRGGGRFVVTALDKLGWKPDQGPDGARYWIERSEWERCEEIGAPAVEPLITMLEGNEGGACNAAAILGKIGDARAVKPLILLLQSPDLATRKTAAEALVMLYRSGRLDETNQRFVLDQQQKICRKHTDKTTHTDRRVASDCNYESHTEHQDSGIGVDFPV